MRRALLLIANASRARIVESRGRVVRRVWEYEHPEARDTNLELTTDKPGRQFIARAGVVRPAYGGAETPHDQERQKFARELAAEIDRRVHNQRIDVGLIAPPAMLGLVRHALGLEASRRLRWTDDRDLTALRDEDVVVSLWEASR